VRRRLFFLLFAAFALKAALLFQFHAHPLLQPAGDMDSGVYARLAWDVAQGDVLLRGPGPVPYFVSPLYIYFLAAIHALSGGSLLAAKVVQVALGTAAVGLVWGTARRLFGARAALVAGVLYALTGVVSFHEILILQAALDPFLTALALFLLAHALTQKNISSKVNGAVGVGRWLATGAAFGLLALNRPNALICVAAVAADLLLFTFKENPLRRVGLAAAFVAGAAATIAPVTLRNLAVSHEFVLISSHGGLNFLVGNGPGASGAYRVLPGIAPDIGGQARDSKKVAEEAEGRPLSTRDVSAHFTRQAREWIERNPADAARLFLRKIHILLSGDEAPLNFSFPWYRRGSLVLKLLAVGPGLLVPLAGAGFVLAFFASAGAARRALLAWSVFVPAYVVAVALFFVATRYRLPLLVALAPLAGAAAAQFPEAWRKKGSGLGIAAATAAILAGISLWPTGLWDGAGDEEMHLVLWEVEKGDSGTMRHAETTAPNHPDPGLFWLRVGRSFEAAGKSDDAITALTRSHEIDANRPGVAAHLSALFERRGVARVLAGDAAGGRPDLEEAVRLDGTNAAACLNLAAVLAGAGETNRARSLTRQALDLQPGYEKALALLQALDRMKEKGPGVSAGPVK
jgi:4-amino-4-deoxy-L-arabinose transferase-like glycosyltransferase